MELKDAEKSGFCNELEKITVENLISLGYPKEAFELTPMDVPINKIAFQGGTEEDHERILSSLMNRKAMVSFTTKEDIDKKANGDYHLYFQ